MTVLSIDERRQTAPERGRSTARPPGRPTLVADDESAHAIAAGEDDRTRFARIVLPHLVDAYSLARWITGNRADAEDVVQEASLRAFRAIRNANANPRAWMLTVVRNTAFTWLRKNRPAALVAVEDLEEVEHARSVAAAVDAETPETSLIAKADSAQLTAAIAALPPVFREVLVLRDIHGLSYREIADVAGVPIGTVMSRLARGRERLIGRLAFRRKTS